MRIILAVLVIVCAVRVAEAEQPSLKPQVTFIPAPLRPTVSPLEGPSVLMGFSPFYVSDGGLRDTSAIYQPVREGGFRVVGGSRQFNRFIVHGQNRVWTGDVPIFKMDTYADCIPLWISKPDGKPTAATKSHCLGTLRLGVSGRDGKILWLDTLAKTTTTMFLPGYTDYEVASPNGGWKVTLRIAPATAMHGLVCRIAFDHPTRLVWQYGNVSLTDSKSATTKVMLTGVEARFVDPERPNGLVLAGWDGEGESRKTNDGHFAEFTAVTARNLYHIVTAWGVPVKDWWVNLSLTMPPTPRVIQSEHGVKFLTAGCPEGIGPNDVPKSLIALSSWKPYPWPAGVVIPVGHKCERLWLLLQNYVHPSKCYVPNGEVVLCYADDNRETTPLVPPYNLDCFFQHFSREGVAVPFGTFDNWPPSKGFSPVTIHYASKLAVCHADALEVAADPTRFLDRIEVRATCSEGILGLAAVTLLSAESIHDNNGQP
jgi:hypothetical protein